MSGLPSVKRASAVKRARWVRWISSGVLIAFVVWVALSVVAGLLYRESSCTTCHSMRPYVDAAVKSGHQGVACVSCHSYAGLAGVVPDGIALQRMAVGSLVGHSPGPASPGDAGCLSCHADISSKTVRGGSVRVRHADFIAAPCSQCHGGTGHRIEGRVYSAPEMESCVNCHQIAADHLTGCGVCHLPEPEKASERAKTAWRTTHGPSWQKTHGSGELDTCVSCHQPEFCSDCHGVAVPHGDEWPTEHGRELTPRIRTLCANCHETAWCEECHGIQMPHPAGFLPVHGARSKSMGTQACTTCHAQALCDDCHFKSQHPDVDGVKTPHGGW